MLFDIQCFFFVNTKDEMLAICLRSNQNSTAEKSLPGVIISQYRHLLIHIYCLQIGQTYVKNLALLAIDLLAILPNFEENEH